MSFRGAHCVWKFADTHDTETSVVNFRHFAHKRGVSGIEGRRRFEKNCSQLFEWLLADVVPSPQRLVLGERVVAAARMEPRAEDGRGRPESESLVFREKGRCGRKFSCSWTSSRTSLCFFCASGEANLDADEIRPGRPRLGGSLRVALGPVSGRPGARKEGPKGQNAGKAGACGTSTRRRRRRR